LWSTGATSDDITVTSSNQYWVEVTDPANGCVGMDTVNLAVAPSPVVALGADTIICDGDVILLNAGNPGSIYAWNTGGTAQTEAVALAGNYFVLVTDANGCEGTDTVTVDVAPPAVADFNVNQVPFSLTFNFFNNSTGFGSLSYSWDFGDTNTSNQADPTHTYGAMGNYIVTLTITDDCGTATIRDTITVDEVNSIDEGLLAGAIKLFPNPTDGKVFVVIQDLDQDVDIHITDVTGREVVSRMVPRFEQDQAIEFDLTNQAEGVYLIRFEANGNRLLRKIVLER
jgi:PKD repeat protein